jgi:catechol 2,3-dioxygenase-like lactoylglutathione lyase family enzyme
MKEFALAHLDWALADNALRKACDAFLVEVFGARPAYEMLITPETEAMRFDREESLLVIGDTMLIPIAPAGGGLAEGSPIGDMLRKNARPGKWIGVALRARDLVGAAEWFAGKGFRPRYDPGMESHYFMISPREALGVRIEIMQGDLPNDPRVRPGWTPQPWREDHPLGLMGLQCIGVSTASLEEARTLFTDRLDCPELWRRRLEPEAALCAAFLVGDTVIEAMQPETQGSPLAAHLDDVKGIYSLTFQVRSAAAAAAYLAGRGLELVGDPETRFAIRLDQAFDRRLIFTDQPAPGRPPFHSRLGEIAAAAG